MVCSDLPCPDEIFVFHMVCSDLPCPDEIFVFQRVRHGDRAVHDLDRAHEMGRRHYGLGHHWAALLSPWIRSVSVFVVGVGMGGVRIVCVCVCVLSLIHISEPTRR